MTKLLFICCFCFLWLTPKPLFSTPFDMGFLYFKVLTMGKEKNGQVSQTLELVCKDQETISLQVFYLENQEPVLFEAHVTDGVITLFADKPSRICLFAIAVKPGKPLEKILVAQTNLVLYGKSSTPAPRIKATITRENKISLVPAIQLLFPENYYWPRTGQTLEFCVQSVPSPLTGSLPVDLLPAGPGELQVNVLENNRRIPLVLDSALTFSYTPSHDERLKKAGSSACRQDILYTRLKDTSHEYALTYCLVLHRSRHGHDSPAAGTLVCGTSLLLFLGIILKKRRTPWWKA